MTTRKSMRIIHRYLGFFLAGIMAVYATSGIIMIFRTTDFLKKERAVHATLERNLSAEELGASLRLRGFKVEKVESGIMHFQQGTYNTETGEADYVVKKLPFLLEKMEHLHKATIDSPIYWLNIFFGLSLLFFVVSSFRMFMPATSIFKKGLYFTLGGIVLTFIVLFI